MTHADLINVTADLVEAKTYAEVGLCFGTRFDEVEIPSKYGIGPDAALSPYFKMTVAEFHRAYTGVYFDILYLDGLPLGYSECKLNAFHSLDWMKPNSVFVIRGVWPPRRHALSPAAQVFAELLSDDKCSGFSIPDDNGLGVLMLRRSVHPLPPIGFSRKYLREHPEILNQSRNFADGWLELMAR